MTAGFDKFRAYFGAPQQGSGVDLAELGLDSFSFLRDFAREVGGGLFRDGMLSVASRRERIADLEDWRGLVPEDARHFATSGLSDLFLATPSEVLFWIESQHARRVRLEIHPDQFFEWLSQQAQRRAYLSEKLWDQRFAELAQDEVLGFVPALALGGQVDWGNLEKVKVREHLSLLAQIHFG